MTKKKRADPAPAIPILIVQEIAVEWSKRSRGGAEAALRNAIAEVAELPFQPKTPKLAGVQTLEHRQVYQEKIGFDLPAIDELVLDPPLHEKPRKGRYPSTCVFVTRTAEGASVEFEYNYWRCGMPIREQVRKTLTLTRNQWAHMT